MANKENAKNDDPALAYKETNGNKDPAFANKENFENEMELDPYLSYLQRLDPYFPYLPRLDPYLIIFLIFHICQGWILLSYFPCFLICQG